jgi:hypothetical protein
LLQPLEVGRRQPDHRFAKRYQIHAQSYERRMLPTSRDGVRFRTVANSVEL